jgi:hypothetical protein
MSNSIIPLLEAPGLQKKKINSDLPRDPSGLLSVMCEHVWNTTPVELKTSPRRV